MNLNQLEYFINAAETLNFTKAAARCFISQTAMTQQIRALEKTIGVQLFIRDKQHVELTAAGRVYLREARAVLARSQEAIRLARTASEGVEGALSIGFIRGFGQSDFSEILRLFHSSYPSITITLTSDNMSGLYQRLEKGTCDVIFSVARKNRHFSDNEHIYIKSYPVVAVLSPGHPLAERKFLTYPDLTDESFILMQPSGRAKDEMEESMLVYERGGFFPNVVGLEGDPETLLLMIAVGMGISIVPEYIIRIHQKRNDLRILPLLKSDGSAETIDFEAVWQEKKKNPSVEHLLNVIKEI